MSMKMSFTSSTAGKKLKGLMHNNSFSVLTSGLRLQFKDLTIKVVSRQQKKKFATKTSGFRCFFFFLFSSVHLFHSFFIQWIWT